MPENVCPLMNQLLVDRHLNKKYFELIILLCITVICITESDKIPNDQLLWTEIRFPIIDNFLSML